MNWATIAPESRIYKGKNLFRWEVSPGLEHHCGICATPLHNARAKTSCIGKHVEPCYRFHQQLHFVGKSHECFGCNSSDEMHHNRHKEILKIIRELSALDQANAMLPPGYAFSGSKPRRGSTLTASTNTFTDTSSESVGGETSKVTRRERKKAKKSGNNSTSKGRRNVEAFPKEELDFVSEALHLSVHESKGAWEGTYIYDHKQPESEESGAIVDDADIDTDIDSVAGQIDNLSVKSPENMTPRQRKTVKKFTSSINHSSYGGGSRKFASQTSPKTDPFDGLDPKIFFRLGVEVEYPPKNSKTRKELVTKLVAAAKEDIEIIEREEAESAMREEGFWRWAGKTAYHAILQTRQELDWATGQKKGAPRIDFPEDEMRSDLEAKAVGEAILDEVIQAPEEVAEDENEWQQVGKASMTPALKELKVYVKKAAVTKKNVLTKVQPLPDASNFNDSTEFIEEESAGDVDEMVKRYSQRLAGKRDLGGNSPTSDSKKREGRLVISVK